MLQETFVNSLAQAPIPHFRSKPMEQGTFERAGTS